MPAKTLADFDPAVVSLGRMRVAKGADFLNHHFPGWQGRLKAAERDLYMPSFDRCAVALSVQGQRGPGRRTLHTHGDVYRAFLSKFDSVAMGSMEDGFVSYELLDLLWREAMETIPPLPPAPSLRERLKRSFSRSTPAFA